MRRVLVIVSMILLAIILTWGFGCGKPAPAPSPTPLPKPSPTVAPLPTAPPSPRPSPAAPWPKSMTITSPPQGTTLAVYSVGVAKIIEGKLKISTAPQPTSGSVEAAAVLLKGGAELAGVTGAEVVYGLANKDPLPKGGPDVMRGILWGEYKSDSHFTVRADSGINSITDLKGKRCMFARPGHFLSEDNYRAVLEAYGMSEKDVIMMPALGIGDCAQALKEGRADCAFQHSGIPAPAYVEVDTSIPLRVISLSDAAIKNVMEKCPWTRPSIVKAGAYKGQNKDVKIITCTSGIICRKELTDELVYAIAKAIDENIADLTALHPQFKNWTTKGLANDPYGIYHAGAYKYYMEKGYLTPESIAKHKSYLEQLKQKS